MAIFRNKDKDIPSISPESQPAAPQASFVVEQHIPDVPVPVAPAEQIISDQSPVPQMPEIAGSVPEQPVTQSMVEVKEQEQPVAQEMESVQPEVQQLQQERESKLRRRRKKAMQAVAQQQVQVAQPKSEERKEIESLLSNGLQDIYLAMTPQQREQFRVKGEQTATAIEELVTQFKASARKVIQLIRIWLNTIPGVNKYFLEQESKIKTDEIMKYQKKLKKKRKSRIEIQ